VEIFDLTHPLTAGMPVHEGDPPVLLDRVRTHESDEYEVTRIALGSHSGTHVDAPRHFFSNGPTLDRFPLARLVGPGVVIDVRPDPNARERGAADPLPAASAIDATLLAERIRPYHIPPYGLVLLWTEGALLTIGAAEVLIAAGAGLVGTDACSLDDEPYPAHRSLLLHDILIVESLCGLERLGPGPVQCAFLPLAVVGTDGAPIRAIAWR
jgi:kynurenine formamidase